MVFRICGFFQVFWGKKLVVTKNRVPSIPAKMKNIFWGGRKFFFFAICLKNTLSTLENRLEGLGYRKRSGKVVFPNFDFFFFLEIWLFFLQKCSSSTNLDGQIFSSKMAKNQGPKSQIRPGAKGCKKRFPRDFGNFSQKMSQNVICKAVDKNVPI